MATNLEVDGKNDSIDLVIHPLNSTLTVELLPRPQRRQTNASNGTYITYPFKVIDYLDSSQVVYEVLANGSEWVSDGVAELALEPGSYRIDVEPPTPSQETVRNRIMSGTTQFDVGLNGNPVDRSIGFDPEWRMNITFTNESGGACRSTGQDYQRREWLDDIYFTDSEGGGQRMYPKAVDCHNRRFRDLPRRT
ncbi:MAG: hypothetical protein Ct9H300mP10_04570 [Methanobacteriota archaeon]|nr:MAG: hypothetical protein Ct9H300mP10_04570 [Euryarchaeota archaeon]